MNRLARTSIIIFALALCAAGLISVVRHPAPEVPVGRFAIIDLQDGYEFASADLHAVRFSKLEAVVRADAARKFPNTRVELGSVNVERDAVTMNVVFFAPNGESRSYLYSLVPDKTSWRILTSRRLWLIPPSQNARGVRV